MITVLSREFLRGAIRKESSFTDRHQARAMVAGMLCGPDFSHQRLVARGNQFQAVAVSEPHQQKIGEVLLVGREFEMHYRPASVKLIGSADDGLFHKVHL